MAEPSICTSEPKDATRPVNADAQVPPEGGAPATLEVFPEDPTVHRTAEEMKTAAGNQDGCPEQTTQPPPSLQIQIQRPIEDIKSPHTTIADLNQPYGIAINSKGEVLIAELGGKRISVFGPDGKKLRSFGEGKFRGCKRIAVDQGDNVLVTDHSHTIQKFTCSGDFVTSVGKKGAQSLQFNYPAGIRVHPLTKNVYVCDLVNHRIQILNFDDLTFYGSFGKSGSGGGEFNCPMDVAFDGQGNVYVSDFQNHRIQVFTPNGELQRNIGKPGKGSGELYLPSGLHVSGNYIYVTEEANNRVSVFATDGLFIGSFGLQEDSRKILKQPIGVTVDTNGLIYVSDHSNNCVHVF